VNEALNFRVTIIIIIIIIITIILIGFSVHSQISSVRGYSFIFPNFTTHPIFVCHTFKNFFA